MSLKPSPDVLVLPYVEAVEVVEVAFFPLIALGLGQPVYNLRPQLHSDVAWQHGQEELLLSPGETGQDRG